MLRDRAFQVDFVTAAGLGDVVGAEGVRAHLYEFRLAAGNPADPVEALLLDVLALSKHRLGRLHATAEEAESPDAARVFLGAAGRLTAEICRTVTTLSAYRAAGRSDTELTSNAARPE
ncbi:MAG: hypothetical protein ACRC7O_00740 [Fimbriiglobus sp.]